MVKVSLKEDWDKIPEWHKIGKSQNEYIYIDNPEVKKISEFMLIKESGSLLVSGARGSGKTSSVIYALEETIKSQGLQESQDQVLLPIYLNAVQIDTFNASQGPFLSLSQILKQLIRALKYNLELKNIKIPKSLLELLIDIDATEVIWRRKNFFATGMQKETSVNSSIKLGSVLQNIPISTKSEVKALYKGFFKRKNLEEKLIEKNGITIEDLIQGFMSVTKEVEEAMQENLIKTKTFNLSKSKIEITISRREKVKKTKLIFIIDELDYYDYEKPSQG